jgi:hypothetical protein
MRLAASRIKIVPELHVNCARVAARRRKIPVDFIHGTCNWVGGHTGKIFASRWHPGTEQIRQFFEARCLTITYLNKKNEETIKKSENLSNIYAS